jgi:hypothetical protein
LARCPLEAPIGALIGVHVCLLSAVEAQRPHPGLLDQRIRLSQTAKWSRWGASAAFARSEVALACRKIVGGSEMPLKKLLDDMQSDLRLAMDAMKRGDNKEAELLLLVVGGLLDKLIRASANED